MRGGTLANLNFRPLAWSFVDVGTDANTNEKVLKTLTIPADMLNVDGKAIKFRYWGFFGATANVKTLRVRLGPTTLTGTVIVAPTAAIYNGLEWEIIGTIFRGTTDAQRCAARTFIDGAPTANTVQVGRVAAANDDAADMLLEMTGQNGTAAANDIVCAGHHVEYVNSPS